jgi:hypothetical protein
MSTKDGLVLYEKHAAEWGMAIFFESANEVYGFMKRSSYDFLNGNELVKPDSNIFMPEAELLKRGPMLDFDEHYRDCKRNPPDRISWLGNIKYQKMLQNQLDLNPSLWSSELDIHIGRKKILFRWFQAMTPYLDSYDLACSAFFPGVMRSAVRRLKESATIIVQRDTVLGYSDFNDLPNHLNQYKT